MSAAMPMDYRGWAIRDGHWPEPAFMATHPDYDASYEGAEDGWVSNGLHINGPTLEGIKAEIDNMMDEMGEAA